MERWVDRQIEGEEEEEEERGTLILLCHGLGGCLSFYGNKIETNSAEDCEGIRFFFLGLTGQNGA